MRDIGAVKRPKYSMSQSKWRASDEVNGTNE